MIKVLYLSCVALYNSLVFVQFLFFLFSHIILLLHSYFLIPPPPTIVGAAEVVVSVVELPKVNQKLSYASRLEIDICFAFVVSWLLCATRGCHGYFCDLSNLRVCSRSREPLFYYFQVTLLMGYADLPESVISCQANRCSFVCH